MRRIRGIVKGAVTGVRLVRHLDEVEFTGPCPCGRCGYWTVLLRGQRVHVLEKTYDKLRFLQAMRMTS